MNIPEVTAALKHLSADAQSLFKALNIPVNVTETLIFIFPPRSLHLSSLNTCLFYSKHTLTLTGTVRGPMATHPNPAAKVSTGSDVGSCYPDH